MSSRLFRQLEDVCMSLGGSFRKYLKRAVCTFDVKGVRYRLTLHEPDFLEFIRPLPPSGELTDILDMDNVADIRESADGSSIIIETSEGLIVLDKTTGTFHLKVS